MRNRSLQKLLELIDPLHTPVEQLIDVARALYRIFPIDSGGRKYAMRLLADLLQHSDITNTQFIRVTEVLYEFSPNASEERKRVVQQLSARLQHLGLSVEEKILLMEALASTNSDDALQQLTQFANDPALSSEQHLLAIQTLVRHSSEIEKQQWAKQHFTLLSEYMDTPVEPLMHAIWVLYFSNPFASKEVREDGIHILSTLLLRADLTIRQQLQCAGLIYQNGEQASTNVRHAFSLLLAIVQNQHNDIDMKRQAAIIPCKVDRANYQDRSNMLLNAEKLFRGQQERQYFRKHWELSVHTTITKTDIPFIVQLIHREVLSTAARDILYKTLREVVVRQDPSTTRLSLE